MKRFTVTYEIVTPESAEEGEAAEHGFVLPGDWHVSIDEALANPKTNYGVTLREAIDLAQPHEDCGNWFAETTTDRCDYTSGAYEQRSIHPPLDITPSSYRRIKKLINAR